MGGRKRQTSFRRTTTALRWPVGVALTSWRYLWRTTPMSRSEAAGSWDEDAPLPLPDEIEEDDLQRVGDGAGPHFHRHYAISIRDPELSAVWRDPDFEASQPAFYYGRVIEIPTPRWTAYDAARFGNKALPGTAMTITERAYTSPIWYKPTT